MFKRVLAYVASALLLTACPIEQLQVGDLKCEAGKDLGVLDCKKDIPHSEEASRSKTCNSAGNDVEIGDCAPTRCEDGFQIDGNQCIVHACYARQSYGTVSCTADIENSLIATKTKTCNERGTDFDYGSCGVEECKPGYSKVDNACLPQTCTANQSLASENCNFEIPHAENAFKTRTCNETGTGISYGNCQLASCASGYYVWSGGCVPQSCNPGATYPNESCLNQFSYPATAASRGKSCNANGSGYDYGNCVLTACGTNYRPEWVYPGGGLNPRWACVLDITLSISPSVVNCNRNSRSCTNITVSARYSDGTIQNVNSQASYSFSGHFSGSSGTIYVNGSVPTSWVTNGSVGASYGGHNASVPIQVSNTGP